MQGNIAVFQRAAIGIQQSICVYKRGRVHQSILMQERNFFVADEIQFKFGEASDTGSSIESVTTGGFALCTLQFFVICQFAAEQGHLSEFQHVEIKVMSMPVCSFQGV